MNTYFAKMIIFIQKNKVIKQWNKTTELNWINREPYKYLRYMAENQQLLVTFVLPYSEIIVAIYYPLYGLCQIRSLNVSTNATKFCPQPSPSAVSANTFFIKYVLWNLWPIGCVRCSVLGLHWQTYLYKSFGQQFFLQTRICCKFLQPGVGKKTK